jgi:hypothetical protein
VLKLNPYDPVATPIVARIHELLAIEAEPRQQRLILEAHQPYGNKGQNRLEIIHRQIETARSRHYLRVLWPKPATTH